MKSDSFHRPLKSNNFVGVLKGGDEVGVDVNEVVMKQYCKLYSKALEKKRFSELKWRK